MNIYFAEVNASNEIGAIHGIDLPSEDSPTPEGYGHLQRLVGWTGYPAKPAPWAVLRWVNGAISWIDPRTIAQVRTDKWAAIKAIRNTLEQDSFTWDGSKFNSDIISSMRWQGTVGDAARALAAGDGKWSVTWKLYDNSYRVMSAADIALADKTRIAYARSLHVTAAALEAQINDPSNSTRESIESIVWPT